LATVMQESAQAALSYIRSRAHQFGLPRDFYIATSISTYMCGGRHPKDGPSAASPWRQRRQRAHQDPRAPRAWANDRRDHAARQGAAIGGLKEKLLGRAPCGHLTRPFSRKENGKNVAELPDNLKKAMKLHFVEQMDEVLQIRARIAAARVERRDARSSCRAARSGVRRISRAAHQ